MSRKSTEQVSFQRRAVLMRGVFEVLRNESEGLRASDVIERLAQRLPPTDYEAGEYASGA